MAKKSDLLWRAAVCGRLMDLTVDPNQKQRFKELRDAWIALAYDNPKSSVFEESRSWSIH